MFKKWFFTKELILLGSKQTNDKLPSDGLFYRRSKTLENSYHQHLYPMQTFTFLKQMRTPILALRACLILMETCRLPELYHCILFFFY